MSARTSRRSPPVPRSAETPVLPDAVPGREVEPAERVGDRRGRARLLERDLGMTVQVAPHRDEGVELGRGEAGQDFRDRFRLVRHVRIL